MIEVVDSIVSLGLWLDLQVQQESQNALELFVIFKNVRYEKGQYKTRTSLVATEVSRNYTYVDYTQ